LEFVGCTIRWSNPCDLRGDLNGRQLGVPTSFHDDVLDRHLAIKTENLTKIYEMGAETVHALRGVDLSIHRGEYVAIMGLRVQENRHS